MLTKDFKDFRYDNEDKSDQQRENAHIEYLPELFHTAACGRGGDFLLEQENKKEENPNQGNRTRKHSSGDRRYSGCCDR